MKPIRLHKMLALSAAPVLGCSETPAVSIEPPPTYNVAGALGQAMTTTTMSARGVSALGYQPYDLPIHDTNACPFVAASQRFVCPVSIVGNITLTRYYQLLDAAGAPLSAWGPAVTSLVNVSDMSGTYQAGSILQPLTVTLVSHETATVSGIHLERQTLNATITKSTTSSAGNGTTTITAQNLVLPKWNVEQYPKSGTVTFASSSTPPSPGPSFTITFDGTSTAAFTGAANCRLNLASNTNLLVCN